MKWRDPRLEEAADPWRDHQVDYDAVAAQLGVSPKTIRHWRWGHRRMSVVQAWGVANAAGIDLEQLIWHHLRVTLAYEERRLATTGSRAHA